MRRKVINMITDYMSSSSFIGYMTKWRATKWRRQNGADKMARRQNGAGQNGAD